MKFNTLAAAVTGMMLLAAPALAMEPNAVIKPGPTSQAENNGVHQFGWPTDSPVQPPVRSSAKAIETWGGVDFRANVGSPVYAAADGTVISAGPSGVVIYHNKAISSRYARIRYLRVNNGQMVKRGDVIGLVAPAWAWERPYFHFQVTQGGRVVDPMDYLPAVDPKAE